MDWWIACSLAGLAVVLWLTGKATYAALRRGRRRRLMRRRLDARRRR